MPFQILLGLEAQLPIPCLDFVWFELKIVDNYYGSMFYRHSMANGLTAIVTACTTWAPLAGQIIFCGSKGLL